MYICIFSSYHVTCSASVGTRSFPGVRTAAVGRLWIGLISPHEEGKKVDINSMIMYHMYIYGIGQTNSCIVFTLLSFIVLQFLRLSTSSQRCTSWSARIKRNVVKSVTTSFSRPLYVPPGNHSRNFQPSRNFRPVETLARRKPAGGIPHEEQLVNRTRGYRAQSEVSAKYRSRMPLGLALSHRRTSR